MRLKKFLSGLIAGVMVLGTASMPAFAKDFPDMEGHWAKNAVDILSDWEIINGDDNGNFRPGDQITRAETATIIDNALGYTAMSNKVFSDVGVNDWYAGTVSRAVAAGVVTGYEDGTIRPSNPISRQETIVMFCRAFGFDTSDADVSVLDSFSDKDSVGEWAAVSVAYFVEKGYIQGNDGQIRGTAAISRAETAAIANNIIGIYATGDEKEYSGDYGFKIAIIKAAAEFGDITLGGAVISPKSSGEIVFGSGTEIKGTLYNLSGSRVYNTGASIDRTVNGSGSSASSSGTSSGSTSSNNKYQSSSNKGGGSSGGSSSSSSSNITIKYDANGGYFEDEDDDVISEKYSKGQKYRTSKIEDPVRSGYTFVGWFTSQTAADNLTESRMIKSDDTVTSSKTVYAGWEATGGEFGDITIAKGSDINGYGKSAAELMTKTEIEIDDDNDQLYNVTGTLNYVKEYIGFPGVVDEGNFLALSYTLPDDIKYPEKVKLTTSFGSSSNNDVYSSFDDDNLTYTRVFYVTDAMLEEEIKFKIDFNSEYNEDYDVETLKVNIKKLKLEEDTSVTETVDTEEEFISALLDEDVTDIVVSKTFELTGGTYKASGKDKTVTVNKPFTVSDNAEIVIDGISFRTSAGKSLASLIDLEGAKSFKLTNVTVKGDFAEVIKSDAADGIIIEKCSFSNTGKSSVCLTVGKAGTSVTESLFENYTSALVYKADGNIKKNRFIGNTADVLGADDAIPCIPENYFDGEPAITADRYFAEPYYTDEECTKLSENRHDAFIIVSVGESTSVYKLSETSFIPLAEGDTLTIEVIPMDARDNTVSVTGGTPVAEASGKVTVAAPATELKITVGDGEEKSILTGHTSTEITVYAANSKADLENAENKASLSGTDCNIAIHDMGKDQKLYIKIVPADTTQKITVLKSKDNNADYTAGEYGIFEIPVEEIKKDSASILSYAVETVLDTNGTAVEYLVNIINTLPQ